jgi:hypothetical protein
VPKPGGRYSACKDSHDHQDHLKVHDSYDFCTNSCLPLKWKIQDPEEY